MHAKGTHPADRRVATITGILASALLAAARRWTVTT